MKLKIKHLTVRARADGTMRYFWQPSRALAAAGWKLTRLADDLSTAITEANTINTQVDDWRSGILAAPTTHLQGSVDDLIARYKKSREYLERREKTRRDYDYYLGLISQWAGDKQAKHINKKMVSTLYETLHSKKPRKAIYMVQVLRLLFAYAERQSIIPANTNPATKMRIGITAKKGRLWSAEDVSIFVAAADKAGYFSMGTAVLLNEWMGQRKGDIITLKVGQYRGGCIHVRQSKTGAEVVLPVDNIPHLKERIERQIQANQSRASKVTTPALIQQENGRPYNEDWFSHLFAKIRTIAMKDMPEDQRTAFSKLVFKDLRHTAITRLAEAGCEIPEIAAISGHSLKSCHDIIDRYNVRTKQMATNAFEKRKGNRS